MRKIYWEKSWIIFSNKLVKSFFLFVNFADWIQLGGTLTGKWEINWPVSRFCSFLKGDFRVKDNWLSEFRSFLSKTTQIAWLEYNSNAAPPRNHIPLNHVMIKIYERKISNSKKRKNSSQNYFFADFRIKIHFQNWNASGKENKFPKIVRKTEIQK